MGQKNQNQRNAELTVDQIADYLQVTPRTVLNYIQAKEMEAVKVGRHWFVKLASFHGFLQRHRFSVDASQAHQLSLEEFNANKKEHEIELTSTSVKKNLSLQQLRVFEKATKHLLSLNWPKDQMPEFQKRFLRLKGETIEFLGRGFYCYQIQRKRCLYDRSREKLGSLLALIYFFLSEHPIKKQAEHMEQELMPLFSSLLRKMERLEQK